MLWQFEGDDGTWLVVDDSWNEQLNDEWDGYPIQELWRKENNGRWAKYLVDTNAMTSTRVSTNQTRRLRRVSLQVLQDHADIRMQHGYMEELVAKIAGPTPAGAEKVWQVQLETAWQNMPAGVGASITEAVQLRKNDATVVHNWVFPGTKKK